MRKALRKWFLWGLLWGFGLQNAWAAGVTVPVDGSEVLALPEWAVRDVAAGGKLLLSDSPEIFDDTGILYSDIVTGHVRLFYHHVNGMASRKRVAVVLENKADKAVKVIIYRKGVAGPHVDYLLVGKTAQQNYFAAQEVEILEIPARKAKILDERAADLRIGPNQLVNGIYDFVADGPVAVKVMAVGSHADPLAEHKRAKVLPADRHRLRGTFPYADRVKIPEKVYDAERDGRQALTLGDGVIDPFITGVDATDGSTVLNYGNYGVLYKIFLPTAADGIDNIDFKLNPRGGVYAGVLGLKLNAKLQPPIGTPGDRTFLESSDTAAKLIRIKPDSNLWVHFMPPGASNLPVKLLVTPE